MMLGTCSEPGRISHIPVQYDYDDYADGLHTDAQCELNPACRSAVCAGTARSLLSLSPTPPETSEINKERAPNEEQFSNAFHGGQSSYPKDGVGMWTFVCALRLQKQKVA